jgi:hypothetical protein
MKSYYNIIFDLSKRLEKIIEWLFEDYLRNEFGIRNFNIKYHLKIQIYKRNTFYYAGD